MTQESANLRESILAWRKSVGEWDDALTAVALASNACGAATTPPDLDAARTLLWQAVDVLDACATAMEERTTALREATREATDAQRRQIRIDRMAGVTVGPSVVEDAS